MTFLLNRNFPDLEHWPAGGAMKCRESYEQMTEWVMKHLYGSSILCANEQEDIDTALERTVGECSLRNNLGPKLPPQTEDAWKIVLEFKKGDDDRWVELKGPYPITAIYVPVTPYRYTINGSMDASDPICTEMKLQIQYRNFYWFRKPETGLFHSNGRCNSRTNSASLRELVLDESRNFTNDFSPTYQQGAENIMLKRLLLRERNDLGTEQNIKTLPFIHTQDEFIGPFLGHDRWQRIVLLHPCLPALTNIPAYLAFDIPIDILVETAVGYFGVNSPVGLAGEGAFFQPPSGHPVWVSNSPEGCRYST
jgi:hypothetical protein